MLTTSRPLFERAFQSLWERDTLTHPPQPHKPLLYLCLVHALVSLSLCLFQRIRHSYRHPAHSPGPELKDTENDSFQYHSGRGRRPGLGHLIRVAWETGIAIDAMSAYFAPVSDVWQLWPITQGLRCQKVREAPHGCKAPDGTPYTCKAPDGTLYTYERMIF